MGMEYCKDSKGGKFRSMAQRLKNSSHEKNHMTLNDLSMLIFYSSCCFTAMEGPIKGEGALTFY